MFDLGGNYLILFEFCHLFRYNARLLDFASKF